jgi:hypothetical protein
MDTPAIVTYTNTTITTLPGTEGTGIRGTDIGTLGLSGVEGGTSTQVAAGAAKAEEAKAVVEVVAPGFVDSYRII